MYSPHLCRPLVNDRIDDLHRTMAASRGRRSYATSQSDRGSRQRRQVAPTSSIRALVARFAH